MSDAGGEEALRRVAAEAWGFRLEVELEAEARFARLAHRLEPLGAEAAVVALARRASADERRHAVICAELAERYAGRAPEPRRQVPPEIAPRHLPEAARVLYEVVAACCVAETGSVGVLTALLGCARGAALRRALRRLAADEVAHARLGWAHLAAEHARGATSFLGPLVPAMLEGSAAADLFSPVAAEREDEGLLEHGVLPHAAQREVFTRTLHQVVFPGLRGFGVDVAPAQAWLERRAAGLR